MPLNVTLSADDPTVSAIACVPASVAVNAGLNSNWSAPVVRPKLCAVLASDPGSSPAYNWVGSAVTVKPLFAASNAVSAVLIAAAKPSVVAPATAYDCIAFATVASTGDSPASWFRFLPSNGRATAKTPVLPAAVLIVEAHCPRV